MRRILVLLMAFSTVTATALASAGPVFAATTTPAGAMSTLRPVGSPILSDATAASHVRRSTWEPRPKNNVPNHTVPSTAQLTTFNSYKGQWGNCDNLRAKVTGKFTGTTDEIIQWAAWKWGLPEDTVRAVAVTETYWRMEFVGDSGKSFGLFQIKNVTAWHGGTYPMSQTATAFNADYWAGMVRQYFEGCSTWLKDYSYNGTHYAAGDLWGSIGAWYSGDWHSNGANGYINSVKQYLSQKTWASAGF
ncbi:MAG: hypothetical protein QOJ09_57 [Actinomycetota bacterium]|jgi:hypothetical protein|nr:hypothetical protein [Actinomycetota bacterium]